MARRKQASMYERSAAIASNLLKASTVGLAKVAFGKARTAAKLALVPAPGRVDALDEPPWPDYERAAMRLVEPESRHSGAYLMEPVDDEGDGGIDGRAAAYIMKVRARHRSVTCAGAEASDYVPPPPTYAPFYAR